MSQKNETTVLLLSLLVTAGLLGAGLWWLVNYSGLNLGGLLGSKTGESGSVFPSSGSLQNRNSLGEKILVIADTTPQKQAGVQAFAKGDFTSAVTQFQSSLQAKRNDPEALIYLNNAKSANSNPLKIVVSVPIANNVNIAQEILRGVAQAQDEFNRAGGLNGRALQVEIANDENNPEIIKKLANQFVRDSSVLAVIGHNSSDASLTAAPIYQQGKLVMISPTSDAQDLSGIGSYIYRTIPTIRSQASTVSDYAVKTAKKVNIAVCADSSSQSSQSFKKEFISALFASGGRVTPTNCDFAAANFSASTIASQAVSDRAEGILLLPSVDSIGRAIDVAQANQKGLSLFGSSTLYTFQTLQQGRSAVNGMVLTVPWNPGAIPGNSFPQAARTLWGGAVNWRTATAYDATQVVIAGLKQNQTREGLQQALSSPGFSVNGATGSIQFSQLGDRNGGVILVKVQPGSTSNTGFDFVPLKP
jgi:branched-chain amino acid transport system substrate-binding protein